MSTHVVRTDSPTERRVLRVLEDGAWHGSDDFRAVTRYPEEWVKELRHDGVAVEVGPDGRYRLASSERLVA